MPKPTLMGILNVTPDSFSDGGLHTDLVTAGLTMIADGADIIDIGGESTRPGAYPIDPAEERQRVLPVIAALARQGARISIDTRNAATMQAALNAGASIVNDVSALRHDAMSLPTMAKADCPVILMHMRGTPLTMQSLAHYGNVVDEVTAELAASVERAVAGGIARARITIDPGLGFAKTPQQSLELLRGLPALASLGLPILVGASRKGFIGVFGGETVPARRAPGSIAAALFAASHGAAIIRTHDVAATAQALRMWQALHGCVINTH